jgi:ribosomal protein L36
MSTGERQSKVVFPLSTEEKLKDTQCVMITRDGRVRVIE